MTKPSSIAQGGCYCGRCRYELTKRPIFKALCYCRACQHIAGGGPQYFLLVPEEGFQVVAGRLKTFARDDLPGSVTRSFCPECGTHIFTRRPGLAGVILKIGTLDDPAVYGQPKAAIFVAEKQPFHIVPDGLPQFKGLPAEKD